MSNLTRRLSYYLKHKLINWCRSFLYRHDEHYRSYMDERIVNNSPLSKILKEIHAPNS